MTEDYSGTFGGVPDGTKSVEPHSDWPPVRWNSHKNSVELETAPEVLVAPIEGLTDPFTQDEGMAAMQSIEMPPAEMQERALVELGRVCRTIERAQFHKVAYIKLARQYGCTNERIGSEMGVTEAAVRMMLKRADSQ
jgi:hypothetical protein